MQRVHISPLQAPARHLSSCRRSAFPLSGTPRLIHRTGNHSFVLSYHRIFSNHKRRTSPQNHYATSNEYYPSSIPSPEPFEYYISVASITLSRQPPCPLSLSFSQNVNVTDPFFRRHMGFWNPPFPTLSPIKQALLTKPA